MVSEIDDVLRCLTVDEINEARQRVLMKRLARQRLGLPALPLSLLR